MAASEIKEKFGTVTALTFVLTSLASSNVGLGKGSASVDNTTTRFGRLHLFGRVKTAASGVTANRPIWIYLLKADGHATEYGTDGWGKTDAAWTQSNAIPIATIFTPASPSNVFLYWDAVVENPGPTWGIGLVQYTGAALSGTAADHFLHYIGDNPENQ